MGTGLQAVMEGDTAVIRRTPSGAQDAIKTKTVDVRVQRYHEIGPMPGLALTREQIPGNVQSITPEEITKSPAVSINDLMNSHLQSVTVTDYQDTPAQIEYYASEFTAGLQLGTHRRRTVQRKGGS